MRVTVLHNPEAGDEELATRKLRTLLASAGHTASCRSTKVKGWKTALDDPGDLVIVAGGDGTVAKVARQLAGRDVPMALVPMGTANNIARSLGVDGDAEALVAGLKTARTLAVDLGLIDRPLRKPRHFIEAAGLGVFPSLMTESERRISKKETPAADQIALNRELMIELLETADPVDVMLVADGEDRSGAYLILEVMNIQAIGPRIDFSSRADPTDGLLDIVAITDADRGATIELLRRCRDGSGELPELPSMRARTVDIQWHLHPMHIDDDQWPDPDDDERDEDSARFAARITVDPGAIRVLVPA